MRLRHIRSSSAVQSMAFIFVDDGGLDCSIPERLAAQIQIHAPALILHVHMMRRVRHGCRDLEAKRMFVLRSEPVNVFDLIRHGHCSSNRQHFIAPRLHGNPALDIVQALKRAGAELSLHDQVRGHEIVVSMRRNVIARRYAEYRRAKRTPNVGNGRKDYFFEVLAAPKRR